MNRTFSLKAKENALFIAFLAAAIFAVYSPSLFYPFTWDDEISITENPGFGTWKYVAELFTGHFFNAGLHSKFVTGGGFYRPLVGLSFSLDHLIWGMNAYGFRLTNIFLHILCSVTFYLMLRKLAGDRFLPMILSFLYAVHPVHIGSVVYVSGRTDLLKTVFMLLSLLSWWDGKRASALILFLFSLLAKEDAVVLPGILAASDLIFRRRLSKCLFGAMAIGLAYVFYRKYCLHFSDSLSPSLSLLHLGTVAQAAFVYIRIALLPVDLHFERYLPLLRSQMAAAGLIALLASLLLFLIRSVRKDPTARFAFISALVVLLPVSNLIPIYRQFQGSYLFLADHFWYLPLMFALALSGYLIRTCLNVKPGNILVLSAVVTVFFLILFFRYVQVWRDTETLLGQILSRSEFPYRAYNNLASYYLDKGDGRCLLYLEKLKKIMPVNYEFYYVNRANWYYFREKNLRKAIEAYQAGINNGVNNPKFYYYIGLLYFELKDRDSLKKAKANFLIYGRFNHEVSKTYLQMIDDLLAQ